MREYTHTEEQYLLDDWKQGDEWTRWGLEWMHNLDKLKRARWRRTLRQIAALPADRRPTMCICWYKRLHGCMKCDDRQSTVDSAGVEE